MPNDLTYIEHECLIQQLREAGYYERVSETLRLDAIWLRSFACDAGGVSVHFALRDDADFTGHLTLNRPDVSPSFATTP